MLSPTYDETYACEIEFCHIVNVMSCRNLRHQGMSKDSQLRTLGFKVYPTVSHHH